MLHIHFINKMFSNPNPHLFISLLQGLRISTLSNWSGTRWSTSFVGRRSQPTKKNSWMLFGLSGARDWPHSSAITTSTICGQCCQLSSRLMVAHRECDLWIEIVAITKTSISAGRSTEMCKHSSKICEPLWAACSIPMVSLPYACALVEIYLWNKSVQDAIYDWLVITSYNIASFSSSTVENILCSLPSQQGGLVVGTVFYSPLRWSVVLQLPWRQIERIKVVLSVPYRLFPK